MTLVEVAEATRAHRLRLSKIANQRGAVVRSDPLDTRCACFGCRIEALVELVDEKSVSRRAGTVKTGGQKNGRRH